MQNHLNILYTLGLPETSGLTEQQLLMLTSPAIVRTYDKPGRLLLFTP